MKRGCTWLLTVIMILATCSNVFAKEAPKAGTCTHESVTWVRERLYCFEEGRQKHYICNACGRISLDGTFTDEVTEEDLVLPADGHQWGPWEVTKEPTLKATGTKQRVCWHNLSHIETKTIAKLKDIGKAKVTGLKASYVYTGKAQKPAVTVKYGKTKLKEGKDYSVTYSSNKKAGTAKVQITGKGKYGGKLEKSFKITKHANTMKVSAGNITLKYSKVKAKKQTVAIEEAVQVTKAKGTVTYEKVEGNSKIKVDRATGKITVAKGTKKGTYPVKIKVTAKGNANYKGKSKTVTCKVIVTSDHVHTWKKVTETVHHPEKRETIHHEAEYKTVHHDAVFETIHHDAEYKTVHHEAEYETVHHDAEYEEIPVIKCWCGEIFIEKEDYRAHSDYYADRYIDAWCDETTPPDVLKELRKDFDAHGGCWTGFTIENKISDAWDERVLVKEAYDEQKLVKKAYDEKILVEEAYDEKVLVQEAYDEEKVTPAWDEEVVKGYTCSKCGASKKK